VPVLVPGERILSGRHSSGTVMTQTTRVIPAPASWLAPLTPLRFLERSAEVFPTKTAMIEGDRQFSCADIAAAAQQLANALRRRGIGAGDRVAFLAHNSAALLIAHFAALLLEPRKSPSTRELRRRRPDTSASTVERAPSSPRAGRCRLPTKS
jgi:non-ribosomal peptide synthetase component F